MCRSDLQRGNEIRHGLQRSLLTVMILLHLSTFIAWAEGLVPESVALDRIPSRKYDAVTGSAFARKTAGMSGQDRQSMAVEELLGGNVPDFLRQLKPVRLRRETGGKGPAEAIVWVSPGYIAIGSDDDFLRIPLTYPSATAVAEAFGCVLPTRKIVDAVYEQATCRLVPEPLRPGPRMRSSEYYLEHQWVIRVGRKKAGCALGELTTGAKKDIVLTKRLLEKPDRIAIYGWHERSGNPIQPLSTVHGARYADYSHGLRLVSQKVWIDGEERSIFEVLGDSELAPLLTYEGLISKIRTLLRLEK